MIVERTIKERYKTLDNLTENSLLSNTLIDWNKVYLALNDEDVKNAFIYVLGKKVLEAGLTRPIREGKLNDVNCAVRCANAQGSINLVKSLIEEAINQVEINDE